MPWNERTVPINFWQQQLITLFSICMLVYHIHHPSIFIKPLLLFPSCHRLHFLPLSLLSIIFNTFLCWLCMYDFVWSLIWLTRLMIKLWFLKIEHFQFSRITLSLATFPFWNVNSRLQLRRCYQPFGVIFLILSIGNNLKQVLQTECCG